MYDMYAWDQPASSADEHAEPSTGASRAVQAVQVALDRRDNGGDAGSSRRV